MNGILLLRISFLTEPFSKMNWAVYLNPFGGILKAHMASIQDFILLSYPSSIMRSLFCWPTDDGKVRHIFWCVGVKEKVTKGTATFVSSISL